MKKLIKILSLFCLLLVNITGIQAQQTEQASTKTADQSVSSQKDYIDGGTYSDGKLHWGITADHELVIWGHGKITDTDPWASSVYMPEVESVVIESGITEIGIECFCNRTSIKSVSLPNDSSYIVGYLSFQGCSSLVSIDLTGATEVGLAAFKNCTSLEHVTFEKHCVYHNWAFDGCSSLTQIDIPCRVVPKGMFANCSSLKHVTFAKGTTKIEQFAFAYSGIEYLVLPEGLRCVEVKSFHHCDELKTIYFPRTLIYVEYHAFLSSNNISDVYYTGNYYDLENQVCHVYQYGNHTIYLWPSGNNNLFHDPTWHYCSMEIQQSQTSLR